MSEGHAVSPPAVGTSPVTSAVYRSTETPEICHVPRAGGQAAMLLRIRQQLTTMTIDLVYTAPSPLNGGVDSEDFRG